MDDDGPKAKAIQLMALAQAKSESWSMFAGGKKQKLEDAAELARQGANQFKKSKDLKNAALAYGKAADWFVEAGNTGEGAGCYNNAATALKDLDPVTSVNYLKKAISIYQDAGKFDRSARLLKTAAEIWEGQKEYQKALESFEECALLYEQEDQQATAQKPWLKVAQFCCQLEDYPRAVEVYAKVIDYALESDLSKFSAKNYEFQSILCTLAQKEWDDAQTSYQDFFDRDNYFRTSPHARFCKDIIAACQTKNIPQFKKVCADYNKTNPLENLTLNMLMRIKTSLNDDDFT